MKNPVIGIDVGSVAVKAVAFAGDTPVSRFHEPTAPDVREQSTRVLHTIRQELDSAEPKVYATGYGRKLVEGADQQVSEIVANAAGAGWLWHNWDRLETMWEEKPRPESRPRRFRTIIDVGGQDSKVITFSPDGLVDQFTMNDRCAAGTGRFLEVMARVLEVDLARLDELALSGDDPCQISTACTVFAESEVVSLLGEGADKQNLAAGILASVAERIAGLAGQLRFEEPVLLDGGASHSRALARELGNALDMTVAVPPRGEFVTALGAAVLARRE